MDLNTFAHWKSCQPVAKDIRAEYSEGEKATTEEEWEEEVNEGEIQQTKRKESLERIALWNNNPACIEMTGEQQERVLVTCHQSLVVSYIDMLTHPLIPSIPPRNEPSVSQWRLYTTNTITQPL